ncbi:serine protease 40 isoform X1 [Pongo abelii]|uniref:serine protease 40 isoform X1 n=1 Tax=Pongo abelii TaxID=9601 RepID=UPI0023E7D2BC|nr:serine protease 40 isoform X1 [Pongo abelii]
MSPLHSGVPGGRGPVTLWGFPVTPASYRPGLPAPAAREIRSQRPDGRRRFPGAPRLATRRALRPVGDAQATGRMRDAGAEGSGQGRRGHCALAASLLWPILLPLRVQSTSSLSAVCGKTRFSGNSSGRPTGKIFGGQRAEPERWPWQASLLYLGRHIWELPSSTATGWPLLLTASKVFLPEPFQLQEAEVGAMDNSVCGSFFQPQYPSQPSSSDYTIHEDMLCAGDLITGKAICRGDSGGPLVCLLNGTWFLMGLSSWSLDCCSPIGPSVFTRLTYFTNWINQKKTEGPPPEPALAPPQETPPALDSMTSQGTVHKPGLCAALLAAHTFLLLLILLGSL